LRNYLISAIILCFSYPLFAEETEDVDYKELAQNQQKKIEKLESRLDRAESRLDKVEFGDMELDMPGGTEPTLNLYGFFDMNFGKTFIDDNAPIKGIINENSFFMVQHFNLYLFSQLSESLSFMGEVRFTFLPLGDEASFELTGFAEYEREDTKVVDPQNSEHIALGGLYIERVHLTWKPMDYFGILVGHYLTPFGIWNVDHGSPVLVTVRQPFSLLHRIVPLAQTGLQFFGRFYPTDTFFIDYAVTLSNGRSPIDAIQDLDENKGLGLRLRFIYEGDDLAVSVGGYGYWGEITDVKKTMSLNPFHVTVVTIENSWESVGSADLLLEFFDVRIQSEFARRHVVHKIHGARDKALGLGIHPNYNVTDAYGLIGYTLPLNKWIAPVSIMPYFMYEYLDLDDSKDNMAGFVYVGGINIRPKPFLVLKAEYSYADMKSGAMQVISAQLAVSF
jgi:hypothetical protein